MEEKVNEYESIGNKKLLDQLLMNIPNGLNPLTAIKAAA
jgi:hypothetical protein